METKIEILSREWVKPSIPTPHNKKEHKLSLVDHFQPNKFVSLLFIFDQNHQSSNENRSKETQHLKKSLSNCLSKFYPPAGKLENPAGVLTVECDDTGALFVEAKVSSPISKALHNNRSWENFGVFLPFEPFINYDELIIIPRFSSSSSSSSSSYPKNKIPLSIQVTRFECGGAAIGVCLSHKVGDTASLLAFLSSWTNANRGFREEKPAVNFDIGREVFPCSPISLDIMKSLNIDAGPADLIGENKVVISKRFVFNKENITQLKQLAVSSSSVVSPTRVEVVASFVWKQIIHVQARKDPIHRVVHAVNLRGRMSRLPDDEFAFGNIVALAPAACTDDGDNNNGVNYGDLVGATRDAFKNINVEHIMAILSLFESHESLQELRKLTTEAMSGWPCSSFCRFPIYDLDFGWGKPVSVGPAGARPSTGVVLTATAGGDGIVAWVALPEEEMSLIPEELLSLQATHFMDSF